MRQEILTGVERRRRWSRADKLRILSEVGVEGASVAEVAWRHDYHPPASARHLPLLAHPLKHQGQPTPRPGCARPGTEAVAGLIPVEKGPMLPLRVF